MMSAHWTSVLPVDHYIVRMNGLLHDYDRKVLTQLYQPLMGAAAYSLYMTLWIELDRHSFWGKPSTHHSLMTVMQLNLQQIFEQRKKLEGLSLLKTYVKDGRDAREFLYELEAPLSPQQFFYNDVLSVYLYNRIGKQKFQSLKEQFAYPEIDASAYRQVTSSFDKVFDSVHHSELVPDEETRQTITLDEGQEWAGRQDSEGVQVSGESFDFDLLLSHLSGLIVPKEAIDGEVKEAIIKLAYVYGIDPLEMSKIVERAYYEGGGTTLEIASIRKRVHEWYTFEYDKKSPALRFRTQPLKYQVMANREPQTEKEKMMRGFETYSPAEFLEEYAGDAKVALSDMKVVESIMIDQKLPPAVVNVLIDYVMRTYNKKFPRALVETIAAQWARQQVKTITEAMELVLEEDRKTQSRKKGRSQESKKTAPKRNPRQDTLPKWMTEKEQQPAPGNDWDVKRKQLEERMKKYKKTQ